MSTTAPTYTIAQIESAVRDAKAGIPVSDEHLAAFTQRMAEDAAYVYRLTPGDIDSFLEGKDVELDDEQYDAFLQKAQKNLNNNEIFMEVFTECCEQAFREATTS